MSQRLKYLLVLAAVLAVLGVGMALATALFWADLEAHEQALLSGIMSEHGALLVVVVLLALVALGFALRSLFQAYVTAPLRMAEATRTMLEANPDYRLPETGSAELRLLARTINQLADERNSLHHDVEERIAEGRLSMEEERNRLAALMSELTQSVVVCNLDGRILLYNNRARLQFKALADAAPGSGSLIGLGRSIFAVIEPNLISHALEQLQHRLNRAGAAPVAHFVTVTAAGQLLRMQMAPVLAGAAPGDADAAPGDSGSAPGHADAAHPEVSGYVLTIDDITRGYEADTARDQLLQSLTEGSRAPLANIRAAVENLVAYPDMASEERERFMTIMVEEVGALSQKIDRAASDHAGSLKARWPLEEMLGTDLVTALQRRIEKRLELPCKIEEVDDEAWVNVDSFSLLQGLTYLAARLQEGYGVREVRVRLIPAGRMVYLDLIWSGAIVATETQINWELEPMTSGGEATPLTLREVVERHGGEIWLQRDRTSHRAFFRFLIPAAAPQETIEAGWPAHGESRPEYYDFDLFGQSDERRDLDDRLLSELTYTVFDTETTGLEPSKGDEIIQIGAVRIVNGRRLRHENFDQLVDPLRRLTKESVEIHGITREMLEGQPTIDRVLPGFHAFCADTVLVAHNAAFDMRFLQLKEEATGVHFTNPVLDTMLLSLVVQPNQESHRLEAIAERLGVSVIGRHTALGDAIVTGEVLLNLIPLLNERGIKTLRQARDAAQKSYLARVRY